MKFLLSSFFAVLALALPSIAQADYGTSVLSTHPEAYWSLDETGTSVFDLSGNRHHGTYTPGCCGVASSLGAEGMPIGTGTSLHVHGNVSVYTGEDPGGKITIGGLTPPSGNEAFSVSLWVKWDGYASTCVNPTLCSDLTEGLVGNLAWAGTTGGWDLQLNGKTADKGDGLLRFNRGETTLAGPALPTGQWTMVTATYDGAVSSLYFNGALVASQADASSLGGGYQHTLFIGAQDYNRNFSGYWGSFNGSLDEVGYWTRVLSPMEIEGLYTGKDVNQKPIVYFIPGIGGSNIESHGVGLWPNAILSSGISGLPLEPPWNMVVAEIAGHLAVNDDGVTPSYSTNSTEIVGSFMGSEQYATFLDRLRALEADGAISKFVPWPYDWRIGVRTAALTLAHHLESSCNTGRTWLMAHSTGGLIIKAALRFMREDGKDPEQCLGGGGVVFLATPHLGAPKAIGSEINPDIFFGVPSDQHSLLPATVADEKKLAEVLRNWLTPYELMPAQGDPHIPSDARPTWFDDLHDGLGDRNVNDDPLNPYLPLAAHTTHVYVSDYAQTLGSLPVYNVFGADKATPESYAPGECDTSSDGTRIFVNTINNAHESAVTLGDGTVPAWSASWPGGGVPLQSQYEVPSTSHTSIPKSDAVFVLLQRIFGATNPGGYPDVPGLLHGAAAVERAAAAVGPGWNTTMCSPVAVVARYNNGSVGVSPDGSIVNTTDGLIEPTFSLHDGFHGASLFIPDHGGPAPVYRFTATGDGRVAVHHTDPDGSQHDFVFFVHKGDKAELSKGTQDWELAIDRAGDGTVDDRMSGNSLDLVTSAGGGFGGGGLGGFGEGGEIGLDATGLSADGDVNLEFQWEIVNEDGDATTADEGDLKAVGAHATFSPADGPRTIRIRVTVKNHRGQTATATMTIQVPNAPPKVDAGPDLSTPFATPVTLHGAADDASAADRAAGLHPHWQFGDGTEADGTDATHAYDLPGVYTATFTATDKDGASTSDTVVVTVEKRAARLDWDAPTTSAYGFDRIAVAVVDPATSARVTSVPVVVTVDGKTPGTLPLDPGAHTVSATLGANALYTASALTTTIQVTNGAGTTAFAGITAGGAKVAGAVWSNGATQKGQVIWKAPDGTLIHVDTFTAYGQRGNVAWTSGTATDGAHIVFHFDESAQLVEAWRNGARLAGSGHVSSGKVLVR